MVKGYKISIKQSTEFYIIATKIWKSKLKILFPKNKNMKYKEIKILKQKV